MRSGPMPKPRRYCAALLLTTCLIGCKKQEEAAPPAPPEVEVTEVTQRNVPIYREWVAQLNGRYNAQITPRVQGYLLKQDYRDGFFVKKGQLLYQVDPHAFEVAIAQAKAQVAEAVANLSNADTNVSRDRPLAAQSAIPQKQLDTDIATQAASQAQLDAAKAQLAQAELNLSWTKVYSPIDGIAGISTRPNRQPCGNDHHHDHRLASQPYLGLLQYQRDRLSQQAEMFYQLISGKRVTSPVLDFIQADGTTYPKKGKIVLVNREVTSQTGTIQLVAEFPNPDAILRPGGFGRVRFLVATNENAMVVPQQAVIEIQSMYTVAVVVPGNKAAFRVVKVGERVGTDWIITEGLKPGDQVIVQGYMKVRDGTPVTPKPFVAPAEPR